MTKLSYQKQKRPSRKHTENARIIPYKAQRHTFTVCLYSFNGDFSTLTPRVLIFIILSPNIDICVTKRRYHIDNQMKDKVIPMEKVYLNKVCVK